MVENGLRGVYLSGKGWYNFRSSCSSMHVYSFIVIFEAKSCLRFHKFKLWLLWNLPILDIFLLLRSKLNSSNKIFAKSTNYNNYLSNLVQMCFKRSTLYFRFKNSVNVILSKARVYSCNWEIHNDYELIW